MKKILAFLLLFSAVVFTSCDPDIQFGNSDNVPKISERLLEMTSLEALSYMKKEGFTYEGDDLHAQHPGRHIFSKGAENAQFSIEAPIVIYGYLDGKDKISEVEATQRMDSEQDARDLYWKWSHYTASVFARTIESWLAVISANDARDYTDRNQFWADFKSADSLKIVYEYYNNPTSRTKEIHMGVTFEEPDAFILEYDTRNYIEIPVPCMPRRIRNGRHCN